MAWHVDEARVSAGHPAAGAREKLLGAGPRSLSDAELLAVLLGTGRRGKPVLELATDLLARFGSLAGLCTGATQGLVREPGLGPARIALLRAALELGRRCAEEPVRRGPLLASPAATRRYLMHRIGLSRREVFCCLFLDSQHRLIRCDELFAGTIDGAAVYPREVLVQALDCGSAAVILAHNHPSGVVTPSAADRRITERLRATLQLVEIRVLDHLVVAPGDAFSFAEHGLL